MKRSKILASAFGAALAVAIPTFAIHGVNAEGPRTFGFNDENDSLVITRNITNTKKAVEKGQKFEYQIKFVPANGSTDDLSSYPEECKTDISNCIRYEGSELGSAEVDFATGTEHENGVTFNGTDFYFNNYVTFLNEGVYRFEVTEKSSSDQEMFPRDEETKYTVYVVAPSGTEVGGEYQPVEDGNYFIVFDESGNKIDKDSIVFENRYNAPKTSIGLFKKVKGAFARDDVPFTFSVTVNNEFVSEDDIFYVVGEDTGAILNKDGEPCHFNEACVFSIIPANDSEAHIGVSAVGSMELIPSDSTFAISETVLTGYDVEIEGENFFSEAIKGSSVSGLELIEPTDNTPEPNEITFTNTKNSPVDGKTGINLNIVPFLMLAILATAGVVALKKTK